MRPPHRIFIQLMRFGERGPLYRVSHQGSILLGSTREPLLDACRALAAKGYVGRLEMWREGKTAPDMMADIQRGATLTVSETAEHGPVFRGWRPFGADDAFPADTGRSGKPASGPRVGRHPQNSRPSAG